MRISYHGGYCCGVKTIHGLGRDPEHTCPFSQDKSPSQCLDAQGRSTSSETNFYNKAIADGQYTYEELFKEYLSFLEKARPKGIVEVCLSDYQRGYSNQLPKWTPVLNKHGFKEVSSCKNSNSNNRVHVFHLCME